MAQVEPGNFAVHDVALPPAIISSAIANALAEDLGLRGDITSTVTIPAGKTASCQIVARQAGVIAGLDLARAAFTTLDETVTFTAELGDGAACTPGMVIANVTGSARALLASERVALNFLGRLSGIATLTRRYVEQIAGTSAQIIDTRKTTPGLRALEKYAVRAGGGMNHRTGLFDAVLIKDNHIAIAGGIAPAIEAARAGVGHMVKIEVEVDTLQQLETALHYKIDAVLLDNMTPEQLARAVAMVDGAITTEASGGVALDTVKAIAQSGVDLISVGALTHSAPVLDLGFDFKGVD